MKIAVLRNGMVGRGLAACLAELGHDVVIGTRDVEQTLARTDRATSGYPPYAEWQNDSTGLRLVTFPEAGVDGELLITVTAGAGSLRRSKRWGRRISPARCSSSSRYRTTCPKWGRHGH